MREGTSACACGIEQWRIFRVSAFVDALAWVVFHRWSCQVLWWHCGGLGFSCSGGVSSRGAGASRSWCRGWVSRFAGMRSWRP